MGRVFFCGDLLVETMMRLLRRIFFVMFLFFLARTTGYLWRYYSTYRTKKKVRRVLARKSLPRTNQNSPSEFSDQIRNKSKKDKTKTSQMMGWIENRPNKFLNQNFVRQGLPAKSKTRRFRFISLFFDKASTSISRTKLIPYSYRWRQQ